MEIVSDPIQFFGSHKMKKSSLNIFMGAFICLATLVLAVPAKATTIGSPILNNGHTYYLLDGKPWVDQEAEAVTLGGHLVTINDATENAWVWNTFGTPGLGLFFGFNDAASEGNFVWSSGEAVTYVNWRAGKPGEPDNCCGGESFGELSSDLAWNDVGPLRTWLAVAEVAPTSVPEPSTLLLMLAAMASLVFLKKRQ